MNEQATATAETRRTGTAGLAWGYNNKGGLGAAGTARALRPIPVTLPGDTVDVQGGSDFTVALTASGQVFTWGGNQWGQLGDGSLRHRFVPHQVVLEDNPHIVAIAAGQDHVLALARHGQVFAWGRNHHGQLGDGTREDRCAPVAVAVPGAGTVTQVAAGNSCSFALSSSGTVQAWGHSIPFGATLTGLPEPGGAQAGSAAATAVTEPRPLALPKAVAVTAVDAGQRHLVVLTGEGRVLTFGLTAAGRTASERLPVNKAWGQVTSISAGDNHTVALTGTGVVLAWGANNFGQLGNGSTTGQDTPVQVHIPGLRGRVVQVIAGGDSVLARTDTDGVYAWGHGGFGQHGTGGTNHGQGPERVTLPGHAKIRGLYAGRYHCFATTG